MSGKIELSVTPKSFMLGAGETAEATIIIRNLGQSVDQLILNVEGLDPGWYTLPVSSVALFPNDRDDNCRVILHPPKTAETKYGPHPFRVGVVSQENREETATVDLTIEIRGLPSVELAVSPQSIRGWKGIYHIQADNPGDAEASLKLTASDAKRRLRYHVDSESLTVPAGGQAATSLKVRLGWLSFLLFFLIIKKEFDFKVIASIAEVEGSVTAEGELIRRPLREYLPKIRIPWFRRKPSINYFKTDTADRRDFTLSWLVKRASEVKLDDEIVERQGEKTFSPAEPASYVLTASNKNGVISQTVNVNPITVPKAKSSDKIRAVLSSSKFDVSAGTIPAQATLELQNLSDIVDKFSVEIEGIDGSWFNRSASSVALMPKASDRVIISLQPPKKKGVRARIYPFAITVHSQNTPAEVAVVTAELEILPWIEFKVQVRPYRVSTRKKGKYRINLANNGGSDTKVHLEATDLDEGLEFIFKEEDPVVSAWNTIEVPMIAKPKRGSMIGEQKRYDITVTATEPSVNDQTANCEMQHKPFIKSWKTIFRIVRLILFIGIIAALIGFIIHWGGGWNLLTRSPSSWWNQLVNQITHLFGR
jgi:hypothetical protein